MAAAAQMGNARSDTEQLIANEKAWAQAAQGSDADRMASYMAETVHLQGTLAVVTGEYSHRSPEWEGHLGDRDLREHVAEAQWPLGRDRQRLSMSDP
jgi:hypothetical protein